MDDENPREVLLDSSACKLFPHGVTPNWGVVGTIMCDAATGVALAVESHGDATFCASFSALRFRLMREMDIASDCD